MTDRVHAAVQHVQTTALEAMTDGSPPDAELEQLPAGGNAMLALCQAGDQPVRMELARS